MPDIWSNIFLGVFCECFWMRLTFKSIAWVKPSLIWVCRGRLRAHPTHWRPDNKKDDPPREKDNSSCLNAFQLGIDFFQLQTQSETSALPQSDACQAQIGTTPSDLWVSSLLTHPAILTLVSFHNLVNQFLTINLFYYILPYKIYILLVCFSQFSPVTQLGSTLCDPMDCSTPGLPVHHQLPEFTQTHVHQVMPSSHLILCRPLLLLPSIFPSIRVFSSESVLHIRWPKYWFQLQHQSFHWTTRTDFLEDGLVGSPCSPRDSQESSPTPQFKSTNSSALSCFSGEL